LNTKLEDSFATVTFDQAGLFLAVASPQGGPSGQEFSDQ